MKKRTPRVQLKALDILKAVEGLGVASKLDKNDKLSKRLDKLFVVLVRQVYQEADEWGGVENADQNRRTH